MVQGQSCRYTKAYSAIESSHNTAKQDALAQKQKEERERKRSAPKADVSASRGAAAGPPKNPWGPIFKSREHFNSLHYC